MRFPENTLAHVDCRIPGDLMRQAFGPAFPKSAGGVLSAGFLEASDESDQARTQILIKTLKPALHALMGMFEGQNISGDFSLALVLLKPEISQEKVA